MISKRKLLKWRKEALLANELTKNSEWEYHDLPKLRILMLEHIDKVLELTQELIDQNLLKEK